MIFSTDKKILKIIRKETPALPNGYYDQNDIWKVFHQKYPDKSSTQFLSSLKDLASDDFISFSEKTDTAFILSSKGIHYYEYCFYKILHYVAQKWIDFFALTVSIISFILSVIALVSTDVEEPPAIQIDEYNQAKAAFDSLSTFIFSLSSPDPEAQAVIESVQAECKGLRESLSQSEAALYKSDSDSHISVCTPSASSYTDNSDISNSKSLSREQSLQ